MDFYSFYKNYAKNNNERNKGYLIPTREFTWNKPMQSTWDIRGK